MNATTNNVYYVARLTAQGPEFAGWIQVKFGRTDDGSRRILLVDKIRYDPIFKIPFTIERFAK